MDVRKRTARWWKVGWMLALALSSSCASTERASEARLETAPPTTDPVGREPRAAPSGTAAPPTPTPESAPAPGPRDLPTAGAPGAAPSLAEIEARLAVGAPNAAAGQVRGAGDACTVGDEAARSRCALERRWADQPAVLGPALALWNRHRVVVALEPERWMDGGFRGQLHLVPEAPVGPHARHLGWVAAAHDEIAAVLAEVARTPDGTVRPMRFRHEGIVYGFFRSVNRTTPSAYASEGHIAYNVAGSLHTSADAVRDTLFHEIVHVNEGDAPFSARLLGELHRRILARCGTARACLAPYAPTQTVVRGGTYYAFQPDNGEAVHEYGAEIATRWFQEHRARRRGTPPPAAKRFKCGPPENAQAWQAVVQELFGGVDHIAPCP